VKTPVVTGDTVIVGSEDRRIYALSAVDRSEQWHYRTIGPVYTSPAVVDGVVYVGSSEGILYALSGG
jgi:outer membrane protein assembly factor BamB